MLRFVFIHKGMIGDFVVDFKTSWIEYKMLWLTSKSVVIEKKTNWGEIFVIYFKACGDLQVEKLVVNLNSFLAV